MQSREAFIQEFKEQIAQNELRWDALSSGPLHAEVVFIGEGPGETEARKHEPWVGGAGTLLWDCVRKYNLHKANVYATNVVKRQISLSRKGNEKHVVQRDELDKWIGLTRWELSRLPNVRLIFALGNYALELFAGKSSGITDWRGSVLDCILPNGKKGNIVYSINPAYAQRELKMEPMFRMDCNKLDRVNRGVFKSHVVEGIINPSYREARRFISDLSKSPKPVALDIEHADGETTCYGLSNDPHHAMCINLRDSKKNRYTLAEETSIMMDIQNLCDSHKIIAQSGGHETYWCWLKDWLKMRVWFDTLLAHHTLYPQMPHSLGFLVSQYTNHPFYKDEGEEWKEGGDIDDWWRYNCKDAALTVAVYEKELKDLQQQGLDKFFFSHVMHAQPHLAAATVHGIAVDLSIKEKIVEMVSADVDKLLAEFHNYVYQLTKVKHYRPNPGSWQQMKELYFEVLKLKGKGASTDDTNRTHMLKNVETSPLAKEMLAAVGRWAEENKFLGTYAKAKASDDGRFRCDYKQFGVQNAPGRLSSAKLITGEGGNLQNQPVRARAMFIADPGCVFPYFDLSQAEARVVAFRANIPKWKDQFERARLDGKYDCHRALASEMFKVPYDKVPKKDWLDEDGRDENDPKCGSLKPTIRYIAKRCLTDKAEVLTSQGWLNVAEASRLNFPIAVWAADGTIDFEVSQEWYVGSSDGAVISIEGQYISQSVSYDHKMPLFNNGRLGAVPAIALLRKRYGRVPLSGIKYSGIFNPHARLRAMIWADGSIEARYPNSVRVSVKKERKAKRLRELVAECNLRLWEGFSNSMYHFRIYGIHVKRLDWSMLKWDLPSRQAFLDELPKWDGNGKRVFNTDKAGLEIIQAIAHISGYRAAIFTHGKPKPNHKQCWLVTLSKASKADYSSTKVVQHEYTGQLYCPTTSTGWFLVRENGKVSVTGNCRHGLNYRMERFRLSEVTDLPYFQAARSFAMYHSVTPELEPWWKEEERCFRAEKQTFNALGRRLKVIQRIDDDVLKSIVAFYPQSTIGDKVTQVWYQCEEDDKWPSDARIVLDVHDCLVPMCSPKSVKTVLSIAKKYAEKAIMIQDVYKNKPEPLIIPAELKCSYPTRSEIDEDGKLNFIEDPKGFHRWSHMKAIEL